MKQYLFTELSTSAKMVAIRNNETKFIPEFWYDDIITTWLNKLTRRGFVNPSISFNSETSEVKIYFEGIDISNDFLKKFLFNGIAKTYLKIFGQRLKANKYKILFIRTTDISTHQLILGSDKHEKIVLNNFEILFGKLNRGLQRKLNSKLNDLTSLSVIGEKLIESKAYFTEDGTNYDFELYSINPETKAKIEKYVSEVSVISNGGVKFKNFEFDHFNKLILINYSKRSITHNSRSKVNVERLSDNLIYIWKNVVTNALSTLSYKELGYNIKFVDVSLETKKTYSNEPVTE